MRFLSIYLGIYFALIIAAAVALWRGGVLAYLSPLSILLALVVVAGVGVLLAIVWRWRPV